MARIAGIPVGEAGLRVRLVYFFTRRSFARLTGRAPRGVIEPLEIYALVPGLLRGYGRLEQATAKARRLDWRLQVLAELKATTVIGCEFCIDLASQIGRRSGLSDQQLLALPRYRDSGLFTELEKLVMDYSAALTRTPAQVPDSLFAQLREHLDEGQLVELTHHIALENLRGRFNVAFRVGAAGFSEGMVCAVPDIAWQQAAPRPANPVLPAAARAGTPRARRPVRQIVTKEAIWPQLRKASKYPAGPRTSFPTRPTSRTSRTGRGGWCQHARKAMPRSRSDRGPP